MTKIIEAAGNSNCFVTFKAAARAIFHLRLQRNFQKSDCVAIQWKNATCLNSVREFGDRKIAIIFNSFAIF